MVDVPASVKGMNDILAPEVSKWQFVEEKARQVLESFAYREVRTPILEYTPLFVRSVGEVTDVVEKQMYTFDDRDGRSVSLRPEGTAPTVRAYIGRAQWTREPVTRWYYIGPMFRHERAQRGRLRQFHQVGAELFGVAEPTIDAEMIAMLAAMLGDFGLRPGDIEVTLNCLGEPEERPAYRDALVAFLSSKRDLERVRAALGALGVGHEIDPRLVRGLDYYTGTIFEIKVKSGDLGAQNTVCGGGRYDRLVESLGGPRTPALGFGLGLERALLALPEAAESFDPALNVFFAPLDAAALDFALPLAHRLRAGGVRVEIEHRGGSLKSQLKRADKLRARLAVIIGENEVESGRVTLKDLANGTQQEVAVDELEAKVRQALD